MCLSFLTFLSCSLAEGSDSLLGVDRGLTVAVPNVHVARCTISIDHIGICLSILNGPMATLLNDVTVDDGICVDHFPTSLSTPRVAEGSDIEGVQISQMTGQISQ